MSSKEGKEDDEFYARKCGNEGKNDVLSYEGDRGRNARKGKKKHEEENDECVERKSIEMKNFMQENVEMKGTGNDKYLRLDGGHVLPYEGDRGRNKREWKRG